MPDVDRSARKARIVLSGDVPNPMNPPSGCRFHPRCPYVAERCRIERPVLRPIGDGRHVACHFPLIATTAAAAGAAVPAQV